MNKFIRGLKKNWLNLIVILLLVVLVVGSFGLGNIGGRSYQSKSLGSNYMYDGIGSQSMDRYESGGFAPEVEVRKITKNANIDFESDHYDSSKAKIMKVSKDFSTIILLNNERKNRKDYRSLNLNVKVDALKLDDYLKELKKSAEVEDFNVYSSDVTGSYVDYTERINRYNIQLEKYVAMLNDDISVEDEIKIQQRIDQIEDNLFWLNKNFGKLEDKIIYSDVRISLSEEMSILDEVDFIDFENGFKGFVESLGASLWFIVYVLGFILPFALVYGIYRLGRRFN